MRLELKTHADQRTWITRQTEFKKTMKAGNIVAYSPSLPAFGLPATAIKFIGDSSVLRIPTIELLPFVGQSVAVVIFAVDFVFRVYSAATLPGVPVMA